MSNVQSPHVVADSSSGQTFVCKHCDQTYTPALPCPIPILVAIIDAFEQLHRHCQPPEWAAAVPPEADQGPPPE